MVSLPTNHRTRIERTSFVSNHQHHRCHNFLIMVLQILFSNSIKQNRQNISDTHTSSQRQKERRVSTEIDRDIHIMYEKTQIGTGIHRKTYMNVWFDLIESFDNLTNPSLFLPINTCTYKYACIPWRYMYACVHIVFPFPCQRVTLFCGIVRPILYVNVLKLNADEHSCQSQFASSLPCK